MDSQILVRATADPSAPGIYIARDAQGTPWGWLQEGDPRRQAEAQPVPDAAVRLPGDLDASQALTLLAHWPAWRITGAGGLELGSGALVCGGGWLSRSVLRLCRLRGCLWRAAQGPPSMADDAEYYLGEVDAAGAGRLPAPPDAVFVLDHAERCLPRVLALCRSGGTVVCAGGQPGVDANLYPDAHKRGVRIVAVSPATPVGRDAGRSELALPARLVRAGQLLPPAWHYCEETTGP